MHSIFQNRSERVSALNVFLMSEIEPLFKVLFGMCPPELYTSMYITEEYEHFTEALPSTNKDNNFMSLIFVSTYLE